MAEEEASVSLGRTDKYFSKISAGLSEGIGSILFIGLVLVFAL